MLPGERFKAWIDGLALAWGDRLGTWFLERLASGGTKLLEDMEPGAIEGIHDLLTQVKENPLTPPEIRALIDRALTPGHPLLVVLGIFMVIAMFVPMVLGMMEPLSRLNTYAQERIFRSGRMDPTTAIRAFWRDLMTEERMRSALVDFGLDETDIDTLINVTKFYPAPADLILWQAREVFEPEMIARYGLDSEFEAIDKEPFYKAGMTDEQIINYWRAHWEHATWMQVVEMLHRGLLTEEQVWDWFRVVEIPPFWRQPLIDSAYTWPTRVDVRRWWDMRTITEERLRELYSGMGYRGENLDDYVRWTKVYVDFPMMMTRFRNGWITEDDIRAWLSGLEIPEDRIQQFIEEKTKSEKAERVASEKDLTVTDIIMAIKKKKITREQGIELIMDLGYDKDEAEFKVDVRVAVEAGSPESFEEFKELTQKWRRAIGLEAKPMPEELKKAAEELIRLTAEIKSLEESITEEKRGQFDEEGLPEETTARLTELQVTRNRAIAELERVQSEYDRLVAEWRHGG